MGSFHSNHNEVKFLFVSFCKMTSFYTHFRKFQIIFVCRFASKIVVCEKCRLYPVPRSINLQVIVVHSGIMRHELAFFAIIFLPVDFTA